MAVASNTYELAGVVEDLSKLIGRVCRVVSFVTEESGRGGVRVNIIIPGGCSNRSIYAEKWISNASPSVRGEFAFIQDALLGDLERHCVRASLDDAFTYPVTGAPKVRFEYDEVGIYLFDADRVGD